MWPAPRDEGVEEVNLFVLTWFISAVEHTAKEGGGGERGRERERGSVWKLLSFVSCHTEM